MSEKKDKILVIDHDADERAMLVEAALEPFGYQVQVTDDGGTGLSMIMNERPDIVILDLTLEGLSGPDVLAALSAQAVDVPVIVLANKGAEKEALQAFRMGAKDYLVRPVREAELIQAVERSLKEVRLRRERETLAGEVRHATEEVDLRLRELKTLMGIGKSVTALRQLDEVFDRVVRAAIQLTRAESVGLLLRDDATNALILRAGQNLSRNLLDKMGQPVEDNLASLVMNSRETYIASGKGLDQFRPAQEGATAVIYAPLVVHDKAIGLLWVANTRLPFEPHMKDIMTALADYAAIAIVNARLFATMQERPTAEAAPSAPSPVPDAGDRIKAIELSTKVRAPLTQLLGNMNLFRTGEMGRLPPELQAAVDVMHRQLRELIELVDSMSPPDTGGL